MPIDPHDVHRVVHGYLLESGWQRHEADSLYHRYIVDERNFVDPEHSLSLGYALNVQLNQDGINLALNPQVVVYPPPIELLAGDPPAHQPGPTATYPDGSPLADPPPPAAD